MLGSKNMLGKAIKAYY